MTYEELLLKEYASNIHTPFRTKRVSEKQEYIDILNRKYPKYELNWQISLLLHGFDEEPCCTMCQGPLSIPTRVRTTTCSTKCRDELKKINGSFTEARDKAKKTNVERYGHESHNSNLDVQTKRKNTMMEKYGALVSPASLERMKRDAGALTAKGRETLRERYGVDNPGQMSDHVDKIKTTMLKNYGVDHYMKSEEFIEAADKKRMEKWTNFSPNTIKILSICEDDEKNDVFVGPNKVISFECTECGAQDELPTETYKWRINRTGTPCAECGGIHPSSSLAEKEIGDFIVSLGFDIVKGDRTLLSGRELDVLVKSKNVAFEYCGLYWHNDLRLTDYNYHLKKMKDCEAKGIRLYTIFEDEWVQKPEVVKSRIRNALTVCDSKISARLCTVKEITHPVEKEFLEKYHLQGHAKSSIKVGLFYGDELVSVMTFSKPNASKGQLRRDGSWELLRFCSSVNVIGGASKLFSYFRKTYAPKQVISFCDLRWGVGKVYESMGFSYASTSRPNYWYILKDRRIHRYNLRKRKNEPKDVTEYELRLKEGYLRIWDCGNSKWIWTDK